LILVELIMETINYKRHQVSATELEATLLRHPRVVDVAVVPYPDDEVGELPCAFVVKRDGSDLTESEVMSFVSRMVVPHKKVRMVKFIDTIPRARNGSILRRELVATFADEDDDE